MRSLFSQDRECWLCGNPHVHKHHVYGGARRRLSEAEGCWLYLCPAHHNMSPHGVHLDRELDLRIKRECQTRWMVANQRGEAEFIQTFGRSYLGVGL